MAGDAVGLQASCYYQATIQTNISYYNTFTVASVIILCLDP